MEGDPLPVSPEDERAEAPRAVRKPWNARRKQIFVLTIVVAWALVATGTLAWYQVQSAATSKRQTWDAEALLLQGIRDELLGTNVSTYRLLSSRDLGYGEDAVMDLGGAFQLASSSLNLPEYAVLVSLNLTYANLGCATYVASAVITPAVTNASLVNDTFFRSYFAGLGASAGSLALLLGTVRPSGTDPIAQLGPDAVIQIRSAAPNLAASPSSYAFGSCPYS